MKTKRFDTDVIDADITGTVIDEPKENLKQATFSRSGSSNDTYLLSRLRFERSRSQRVRKMFSI